MYHVHAELGCLLQVQSSYGNHQIPRDAQNQHILASMVALFEAILINKIQHFYKIMPFLLIL